MFSKRIDRSTPAFLWLILPPAPPPFSLLNSQTRLRLQGHICLCFDNIRVAKQNWVWVTSCCITEKQNKLFYSVKCDGWLEESPWSSFSDQLIQMISKKFLSYCRQCINQNSVAVKESHVLHLIEDALQCGRCVHLGNVKLLIVDLRTKTEMVRKLRLFLCLTASMSFMCFTPRKPLCNNRSDQPSSSHTLCYLR